MSGPRVAYVNARLLDPASNLDVNGALLTEGAAIADLGPRLFADGVPDGIAKIDCKGACLAPGLIDARVHTGEPGAEHKDTIATVAQAAAAGGVTTVCALPNTVPVIDDVALVEFVERRAEEAGSVKFRPYAALTRGAEGREISEMGLLAEAGAIGFTDGTRPVTDSLVMRRALSYARGFDLLVMQHPHDMSLKSSGVMNAGETATRLGLGGIPAVAEVIMLERDLRLVEMTGARYHASLLSTAESVDAIRRARARGLRVTCDTAPQYFALNELEVGDYRTFAKLSPPLRSEADRAAVVAGLADGTIDAIVSDHCAQDQDSKRLPFAQAEDGIVGLETLLALTLELFHNGSLSLLGALAGLTRGPAGLLDLPGGRLARERPADLVIFDPATAYRIDLDTQRTKSKNSPFDKRPVQGRVLNTVIDGKTVYGESGR